MFINVGMVSKIFDGTSSSGSRWARCRFGYRIISNVPEQRIQYITCWFAGRTAESFLENIKEGQWLMIHGTLRLGKAREDYAPQFELANCQYQFASSKPDEAEAAEARDEPTEDSSDIPPE